jgi:hypothetical protein
MDFKSGCIFCFTALFLTRENIIRRRMNFAFSSSLFLKIQKREPKNKG